jgi:hypothetical protein
MNVFVFDLLPYAEHLDHLKGASALKRHTVTAAAFV